MSHSSLRHAVYFIERGCWAISVIGVALAVRLWRGAQPRVLPQARPIPPASAVHAVVTEAELIESAGAVVEHDPFRLARHPSPIPFKPEGDVAIQAQPRVQRPMLALGGIIGGPPWSALLEGIPGRAGAVVVQRGDTLAGLRVREIARDHVLISGMDTLWRLTLKRVWQ